MVILVVFNNSNVVKNLKKPDPVARQMPPFYTTNAEYRKYIVLYVIIYIRDLKFKLSQENNLIHKTVSCTIWHHSPL